MSEPAIIIRNLNKSYGNIKAVNNLDFQVESGECFGLLGPNGAGKTTTMKIIYGKAAADDDKKPLLMFLGIVQVVMI
ncbi:ATP-binding cassette domain-containing protein [Syntrophomonas palmitatica]|uniref:ATP-binding cassette domain-containing protein n=1 Tax=Syntrophomonas palmitatica TaxID=402877 RepID=UPI000AB06A46|nr:ATP-binding cassette domain-containing protein [Syntrophomonas palmitatica]